MFAAFSCSIFLAAVIGAAFAAWVVQRDARQELFHTLHEEAIWLRALTINPLSQQAVSGITQLLQQLSAETGTRLTLIGPDGVVLADSQEDPAQMDNHLTRPEIQAAMQSGSGTATRYSFTTEKQMLYYALAVEEGGRLLGFVRTSIDDTLVRQRLGHLSQLIIVGILIAVALSIVPSYVLSRRLSTRLSSIAQGARAIAAGQPLPELVPAGSSELDLLSRSINQLASELREQLLQLTQERNRMRAILGGMVEGVIAVDADQRIVHINDSARSICSITASTGEGQRLWEAVRVPEVLETVQVVLDSHQPAITEIRLHATTGDQILETICAPLLNAAGITAGAVAVLHDVTRLRQLENLRREFIANASHELKTPLTAIHGIVETLQDDQLMQADVRQRFTARLGEQSRRLEALIDDMLTLSRVESRERGYEFELVDFCALVKSSWQDYLAAAENKQLVMTIELPHQPLQIMGDVKSLRQAVENLLDNAVKYTPAQGQIYLRLAHDAANLQLDVSDTGGGIASEHHERIFERFYRVDRARSRELGGTGLGLSIVKHVVLAHGGAVGVTSQVGRGSTFTIRLPLLPANEH